MALRVEPLVGQWIEDNNRRTKTMANPHIAMMQQNKNKQNERQNTMRHDFQNLGSIGAMAKIKPVKPPIVKTKINPIDQSIGVSKVIEPRHMVATQLKILTPVGTAINIVAYIKKS